MSPRLRRALIMETIAIVASVLVFIIAGAITDIDFTSWAVGIASAFCFYTIREFAS